MSDALSSVRNLWQKFALIFAAIIFNTNTSSFVVIIANIAEHFGPQGMTSAQVSLLQTLPALFIVPATFISGLLVTRMSKKTIILMGWLFYGLCGVALYFVQDYMLFIAVRACMGIGIGLVLPQPRAMVTQLYQGEERANIIGYISMVGGLVSFAISLSLGYVAAVNWRYALFVYPFFAVIAVVLVALFVTKVPPEPKKSQLDGPKEPLGKFVWATCIAGFFIFVIGSVIQIKTGSFVRELGLGASQETGWVSACVTLGTFVGGLLFGRIHAKLKRWTFAISALWAAFGYLVFVTAGSVPQLCIGGFIAANGSIGTIMPYLVARVSFAAPLSRKTFAMTMVSTCTYLGQFMGTFYIQLIESIFGNAAIVTLSSVAVAFTVISVCGFIFIAATKRENDLLLQQTNQ